ncbi:NAD(+)/NADH kinase [Rubricoccus marinus]|uniref:NAD kinase n=1 Tax=Rubricoccus marinus TaxID=716817 RepID=A0A259TYP1_9BACT|nr:NAD(+)/NADH kinase [Rubricoccus marinus]OZC02862.1 ATP-NAD kinase [Rubricoccus marinus]
MAYGITGNPHKDGIWQPIAELTRWLHQRDIDFCLTDEIANGLLSRDLVDQAFCSQYTSADVASGAEVLLSFGGDGTFLRSAHAAGLDGPPILGVNVGRLGFLARVEVNETIAAIEKVDAGETGVEERLALAVEIEGDARGLQGMYPWALNDLVVDKSGTASMIAVEATVDGLALNTYWADGLITATPTGSTAYALSVGGPIVTPQVDGIVLAPIAPHTLTARPIMLPGSCELEIHVTTRDHPYVLAIDGRSGIVQPEEDLVIRVRRASGVVRLVTLPGEDYFKTVRTKLSWGQSAVF